MQDLCSGAIGLDTFRGVAFVGGFSYADVLGSAKGRYEEDCMLPFHILEKMSGSFCLGWGCLSPPTELGRVLWFRTRGQQD